MRRIIQSCTLLLFALSILPISTLSAQVVITESRQKPYFVEQMMVLTAIIQDNKIIETILTENGLPVNPDSVEYLQIIDVTDNGFGDEDVVVVYPWRKAFTFIATGNLKEMMDQWEMDTENRMVTKNADPRHFEQIETSDSTTMAKNWMLASILRGVNNNYSDVPMKIYFERKNDGTINFNTWGYSTKKDAIKWKKPAYMPGEPIKNYDVFRVHRVDSVTKYISNTTLYDQIYIYHQTKDTVFIASDSTKKGAQNLLDTNFQPGLIAPSPDSEQANSDSTSFAIKDKTAIDKVKMEFLLQEKTSQKDTLTSGKID
ncbi:MAG: hypothetical protein H6696_02180 [Deferribacteres bacterium]|nr:hypothetical protein [candidate division KSB1 bacterium]MCB9500721.1 hypothetical protein [Deferribacteres bacterium]